MKLFFCPQTSLGNPDKYDIRHEESRRNQAEHFYTRKEENGFKMGFWVSLLLLVIQIEYFVCLVNV